MPFIGKAHVAYIPNGKVIGVSKLARILDMFAKRMQIQERIGEQVTSVLMEHLEPLGAACIIEASHLCTRMRGVEKQSSVMITSSLKGVFIEKSEQGYSARNELMSLIKG
jgi:GTP cyclohydrolase I